MRNSTRYTVVINHEEQYSIWLADKPLPRGWQLAGKQGSQEEYLDFIEEVWTDMKPIDRQKILEQLRLHK